MSENPVACPISFNKSDRKASGDYLEFEVPEEIEDLNFSVDGKDVPEILESYTHYQDNNIFAKLVSNSDAPHIVFDLEDNGSRHKLDLKIRGTEDDRKYWLTLPAEYWKHNEASPFYGSTNDDEAVVEVDVLDNLIRLYNSADYMKRIDELVSKDATPRVKKPILYPLPVVYRDDGFVDLASGTSYEGDEFEIVPIDGAHDMWYEHGRKEQGTIMGPRITVSSALYDLQDKYEMPGIVADKLTVYWDPDPELHFSPSEKFEVYSEKDVRQFDVVLPRKGGFVFDVDIGGTKHMADWSHLSDGGTAAAYIYPDDSDGGWYQKYNDINRNEDEPFKLYAPAPLQDFKPDKDSEYRGKELMWYWD